MNDYKKMTKIVNTYNVGVSPSSLAITNNNKYGYVCNSNNFGITGSDSVTVLNLKKGIPETTIYDSSFNEPYRIAIDHCDKYAYVCNSGSPSYTGSTGTVSIIDLNVNKVTGTINGFDGPGAIVLIEKNNTAYVTNYGAAGGVQSGNGTHVSLVNLKTNQIQQNIVVDLAPSALTTDKKYKYVYVTCYTNGLEGTGTVNIIDINTNNVVNKITGFFGPFDISIHKKYAYVSNFGSNNFAPYGTSISIVNLKQNSILMNIQTGIQPAGILNDSKFIYVTNYNSLYANPTTFQNLTYGESTLSVICIKTHKIICTIPIGQTGTMMAMTNDCKKLFICKYVQNTVVELRPYD